MCDKGGLAKVDGQAYEVVGNERGQNHEKYRFIVHSKVFPIFRLKRKALHLYVVLQRRGHSSVPQRSDGETTVRGDSLAFCYSDHVRIERST